MKDNNDLVELVNEDKQHIIDFLNPHNITIKSNDVILLYSDGEVNKATIDQQVFINLWELKYEPSIVKVKFIIERPKKLNRNIKELLESLIDKITTRRWHDNHRDKLNNHTTVDNICFKSIEIKLCARRRAL